MKNRISARLEYYYAMQERLSAKSRTTQVDSEDTLVQQFVQHAKQIVMKFYMLLESTTRSSFQIASANLWGPCLRHMKRRNAQMRGDSIIIEKVFGDSGIEVVFSLAIDATKVPECFQISAAHGYIFGGSYLRHMIEIPATDDEVKKILNDESIPKAEEIKACVVSFQNVPVGKCPFYIIAWVNNYWV